MRVHEIPKAAVIDLFLVNDLCLMTLGITFACKYEPRDEKVELLSGRGDTTPGSSNSKLKFLQCYQNANSENLVRKVQLLGIIGSVIFLGWVTLTYKCDILVKK